MSVSRCQTVLLFNSFNKLGLQKKIWKLFPQKNALKGAACSDTPNRDTITYFKSVNIRIQL